MGCPEVLSEVKQQYCLMSSWGTTDIQAWHGVINRAVTLQSTSLNSGKLPSVEWRRHTPYHINVIGWSLKKRSTTEEIIAHYIAMLQWIWLHFQWSKTKCRSVWKKLFTQHYYMHYNYIMIPHSKQVISIRVYWLLIWFVYTVCICYSRHLPVFSYSLEFIQNWKRIYLKSISVRAHTRAWGCGWRQQKGGLLTLLQLHLGDIGISSLCLL